MHSFDTQAARRRAELQWQELARQSQLQLKAAHQMERESTETARLTIETKTKRLRALRLAKEEADRRAGRRELKRTRRSNR